MRPGHYYYLLAVASGENPRRGQERRRADDRAPIEAGAERPSLPARLGSAILTIVRRDHSLTDYPCRLPDGSLGRVAVVPQDGDWTLVCRVA